MKDRRRSHVWGIIAEYLCMALLVVKGYTILARRHRNHGGEIDIIARRGGVVAFIEVKARASAKDALESVTADKCVRLQRAAEGFVASHPRYAQLDLRFDVMVITSPFTIHHLQDAWRAE